MNTSPARMNDYQNKFSMRAKRLTYQSKSSPFGLWNLSVYGDDPLFALCYAPYGESFPPISSRPALEQSTIERTNMAKSDEADILKPWEKGSKSGKRIKKGRGPKARVGRSPATDIASSDISSYSSSNSSFENRSSVSSNATSFATTSTQSSLQISPASRTGWYPNFEVAQYANRPTARILPRPTPCLSHHPDTAQAATVLSRKKTYDRFETEAPAPSAKMYKRE
ncbi:hypothetical protein QM012_008682 [Aureobasidium pullulans]|uniref:Uncharacterized protein n=1 Tax=Aureobasidium pullulans TaxID=5580 RepID=A0ABR0TI81_AURPU